MKINSDKFVYLVNSGLVLLFFIAIFVVSNISIDNLDPGSQKAQVRGNNTYYVDATSGNDSNTGLSEELAWKTISKINRSIFNPGDQILFKRGEIWREQLVIPSSGSDGLPIVFDAYGSGDKPIISGADLVTGWTQHEGNIYVADVGPVDFVEALYINGVFYDIAHYPNNGYLLNDKHSSDTISLYNPDPALDSGKIVGAQVSTRAVSWSISTNKALSYDSASGKITLDGNVYDSSSKMRKNNGFYLKNLLWMVDSPGEWFYDTSSGKIYVMSPGGDLNSYKVEIPKREYGIQNYVKSHIVIQNLNITKASKMNIIWVTAPNSVLKNLDLSGSQVAIYSNLSPGTSITDNNIQNSLSMGLQIVSREFTISNNVISNTGNIGLMPKNSIAGIGINGYGIVVSGNTITNSGYNGIIFGGENSVIENNTISKSCLIIDDCAAIYSTNNTSPATTKGGTIRNNIISDSIGNNDGKEHTMTMAHGIYIDDLGHGYLIDSNVVHNTDIGIFLHTGYDIVVKNNVVHDSRKFAFQIQEDSGSGRPEGVLGVSKNNIVTNNIFESIAPLGPIYTMGTKGVVSYVTQFEDMMNLALPDNNIYCMLNDDFIIGTSNNFFHATNYTLSEWQKIAKKDLSSIAIKNDCPDTISQVFVPTPTPDPSLPTPTPTPTPLPDATPIPTPPPGGTNGLCATTLNSCRTGSFSDIEDTSTKYNWFCLGINGGYDTSCSLNRFLPPINNNPPNTNRPTNTSTYRPGPISNKINYIAPTINIPTTTVDISMPKLPSWLDFITAFVLDIANDIIRGVKRTGEMLGM